MVITNQTRRTAETIKALSAGLWHAAATPRRGAFRWDHGAWLLRAGASIGLLLEHPLRDRRSNNDNRKLLLARDPGAADPSRRVQVLPLLFKSCAADLRPMPPLQRNSTEGDGLIDWSWAEIAPGPRSLCRICELSRPPVGPFPTSHDHRSYHRGIPDRKRGLHCWSGSGQGVRGFRWAGQRGPPAERVHGHDQARGRNPLVFN